MAGGLMIASGTLHSVAGWPALVKTLAVSHVPSDVVAGLAVPWHFTGIAMAAFGVVAIWTFLTAWRSAPVPLMPVRISAVAHLACAAYVGAFVKLDLVVALLAVPGLMVLGAAVGGQSPARGEVLDGAARGQA
jgi:hypothetical protein